MFFGDQSLLTLRHWDSGGQWCVTMGITMLAGRGTNYAYSKGELLTFAASDYATQPLNYTTWVTLCQLGLSVRGPTLRGTRGGTPKHRNLKTTRGVNYDNLRSLSWTPLDPDCEDTHLSICTVNVQSILTVDRSHRLADFIIDKAYDVVCVTETWWRQDTNHAARLPPGYSVIQCPRSKSTGLDGGGGVAIIYKSHLEFKVRQQRQPQTFECIEAELTYRSTKLVLCVVYRTSRRAATNTFLEEFGHLIDSYTLPTGRPIIVGDFNLHLDQPQTPIVSRFLDVLHDSGFKQHVTGPTHIKGHTLDLVITHVDDNMIYSIDTHYPGLSDHFAPVCTLTLAKPTAALHKWVMVRKLKQVDQTELRQNIQDSTLRMSPEETLEGLVAQYNGTMASLINKHAPLTRKRVILRPPSPWFNKDIREAKQVRHRLERQWRRSRLHVHREILQVQCNIVTDLVRTAKRQYYADRIADCGKDQKQLFRIVHGLLKTKGPEVLPKHDSDQELADSFNEFFVNKIVKIRDSIGAGAAVAEVPLPNRTCSLDHFTLTSGQELAKILAKMSTATCELDPMPSSLVKKNLDVILPTLVILVNRSLQSGTFPSELKSAVVRPLLKRTNLDIDEFRNYRPVSNLAFLGKIIEKVVATRLVEYMDVNQLGEQYQSAYKRYHSTETGLLRVQNDILTALDKDQGALLVLLDMSAAFDTIDHGVLLDRLTVRYGITGTVHKWIESYLSGRSQRVKINDSTSQPFTLQFGVPQGSVMGPILYIMYAAPIGDIISKQGLQYHIYADDTQIYIFFETNGVENAVARIEACTTVIRVWMKANMLKLSDNKTELLYLTRNGTQIISGSHPVTIGDTSIQPVKQVRDLGIMFDEHMTMQAQISAICSSGHFHLKNIGTIRRYLTVDSAE